MSWKCVVTGVEFQRVDAAEAMEAALRDGEWDIILSDFAIPHFGGMEALKLLKESGLDLPFILLSGKIGEEQAVQVMKAGAHGFIRKDRLARLTPAVERELREANVRNQLKMVEEARQKIILELDKRVAERTSELLKMTEDLRGEVSSHKRTVEDLHSHQTFVS